MNRTVVTLLLSVGIPFVMPANVEAVTLSNAYLEWEFSTQGKQLRSIALRNKLTGRRFVFRDVVEVGLTFSAAMSRIEIPSWKFILGAEGERSSPEQEEGYRAGYQSTELPVEKWRDTWTLLLRPYALQRGIRFDGYGWFRQQFFLPGDASGQPITLCLGGYNHEDWQEYWVWVNGAASGHRATPAGWHEPGLFRIQPGSAAYSALKFGSSNTIAVRVRGFDRRFRGLSDEVLERFRFDTVLADQFVTLGEPFLRIDDFELRSFRIDQNSSKPRAVFELSAPQHQIDVSLHYELDGPTRRKWVEIRNSGAQHRLLLDVDVDDFRVNAPTTDGDYGDPALIDEEVFAGIEHPAGVNQAGGGRLRLRHHPGRRLAPGESLTSKTAVWGVADAGRGAEAFRNYLSGRSPRKKKILALRIPFGINPFQDGSCWTLNEPQMLEDLKMVERWKNRGFLFDYYVLDAGWVDSTSDLTGFKPECFPRGPASIVERVKELGMKFGMWFSGEGGDWGIGLNPSMEPSHKAPLGGSSWPPPRYRAGYNIYSSTRMLCVASEPYFSTLRNAIVFHAKHNNMEFFKLDMGGYYCNSTTHGHLPGKYSTEAAYDKLIELAEIARKANPEMYVMWYWGPASPYFALHGDTLFDNRLRAEAASTSDYPAVFFRDSVSLNMDQTARFGRFLPHWNKDSLGIWIAETSWGNYMRKERMREAVVMDLARGAMLFPQLWGNLSLFSEDDVAFLARVQKLVKANERLFDNRKFILGDPWKNEVYGTLYSDGQRAFLFLSNMHFEARTATFRLDERVGLGLADGQPLNLRTHFPEEDLLVREGRPEFQPGESITVWMQPFETAWLEVGPSPVSKAALSKRELPSARPEVQGLRLKLIGTEANPDDEVLFRDAAPGIKRVLAFESRMPDIAFDSGTLVVTATAREGKMLWRNARLFEMIQAIGSVGGVRLNFERVPNHRQTDNKQNAPWLAFRIPSARSWSGKDFRVALTAYLPASVNLETEAWLVPNWWERANRRSAGVPLR